MQTSRRFSIATHVLLCLRAFRDLKATSVFLAGSVNVHPVVVRNVLGRLKRAGLVAVAAGTGGARLAREPRAITLLDVYRAVEDHRDGLFAFHDHPNPRCPVGKHVRGILENHLRTAQRRLEASLAQTTLADIEKEWRTLRPKI